MNGHSLGYIYGWGLTLFALSILPPLSMALAENETAATAGFLVTGLTSGFAGVALIIALKGRTLELNVREKILLITSLWISFSLLAAIPFEASGAITSRLNAIFEATSAITTTGATTIDQVTLQPKSILLWRAELQWLGGFFTLLTVTFALVRIWGAERAEQDIFKSPTESADSAHHLLAISKLILPIYGGLTALFTLALVLSGFNLFDAVCIVMSTISTGGMLPRDGTLLNYGHIMPLYILSFAMFFGSVSILWSHFLIKNQWHGFIKFKEPLWVGGTMIALTLLTLWLKWNFNEQREFQTIVREFGSALFDASALISTTGITSSAHSYFLLSPALILIFMIIGGGILSTAGGIKFTRVLLMIRQSRGELRSLIYPNEVRPLFLSNEEKDYKYLSTVWVIFGITILLLVVLASVLSFYGLGLEAALFTAVSALSNCGPCLTNVQEVHNIGTIPFSAHASPVKVFLIIAMVIGRLEFLAALSLLHISFWRD